jgi:PKD repeat protein
MKTAAGLVCFCSLGLTAAPAAVYNVGPGQPLASIGAVPWATLQPGDTVRIHYRAAPYREKWVICRQGTAAAPITVIGVPGPNGERPIVEGTDAITAPGLNYWSEQRGILKIGGANTPADTMPKHIIVEGLEIRGARTSTTFRDDSGNIVSYAANASTVYVEKCEFCTIRNNVLHDAGNVFFVASSDSAVSRNILVQGNYIFNGGNPGSIYEHNIYTAAAGITFEANRLGRLTAGAGGNNLKDRSAGAVIRYNWIEGGNRQLDLVDGEDSSAIRSDASYRAAHVYGNVLIEYDADGNRQMVHYGGDSGNTAAYRKGTLYFYGNTLISLRTDRTTLFRGSTNEETIDARNNVFYTTDVGSDVSLADQYGVFSLSRNFFKPGWRASFGTFTGTIIDDGTSVLANSPGFADEAGQDYRPSGSSALIDAGGNPNPVVLPQHAVALEYVKHSSTQIRPYAGLAEIGAFEAASGGSANQPPVASFTASPVSGAAPLIVIFNAGTSHDPDGSIANYSWEFGDGAAGTGVSISHTYSAPGAYTALLRVTDNQGATASSTQTVTVQAPPPEAPVVTGSAGNRAIVLTWEPVPGATGYRVERRRNSNSWGFLGNVTGTSFSESRRPGSWAYRVRSFNAAGSSPWSNIVTVTVQ